MPSVQVEILQENLNHSLSVINRVIASRPQIPILANILIEAKEGKLFLTASNLETSVVVESGAKIVTEGEFTVPGRTLSEIISSLPADKILLEVVEGSLLVKAGSFHARVNGVSAAEYPRLSEKATLDEGNYWEIDKKELLKGLTKTLFSAAGDESRAVLTGVLFKSQEKGLTLVSADGFRLSVVSLDKVTSSKKEPSLSLILPSRSLSEVVRILSDQASDKDSQTIKIFISSTENQVYFDLANIKIFSRLIAGNFPDYEKIIPSKSSLKVTASAEELSKAVRLASIFARDSANIVKFKVKDLKLKISANAAQVGENESEINVTLEGEDQEEEFTIAFNYRYLLDFLAVGNGEVVMEFSGAVASGVFRFSASPNFLHLIMPVRLQN